MRVVILEPQKSPEIVILPDGDLLRQLQKVVGGYVEAAISGPSFVVYCNEEGHIHDLPFNCFRPSDGHPLVGTLVAVKVNAEGEEISMTEMNAEVLVRMFAAMTASRPASLDVREN